MKYQTKTLLAVVLLSLSIFFNAFTPVNTTANFSPWNVPFLIEDNHGGAFYYILNSRNPGQQYLLLNFDAHPDTSEIPNSDSIRNGIKTNPNHLAASLKQNSIIQCYNWLEPLIPSIVTRAIWIMPESVTRNEAASNEVRMRKDFTCSEDFTPREDTTLVERLSALRFQDFLSADLPDTPVIVSIDLDFFAGSISPEKEFGELWKKLTSMRNIQGIFGAISRPYLANDREADSLLHMLLEKASLCKNLSLMFEPFDKIREDNSLAAQEYINIGKTIPSFDVSSSSGITKAILRELRGKLRVSINTAEYEKILDEWTTKSPMVRNHDIVITSGNKTIVDINDSPLELRRDELSNHTIEVDKLGTFNENLYSISWFLITPESASYNITGREYGFADNAGNLVQFYLEFLPQFAGLSEIPLEKCLPFLSPKTKCGTFRLVATLTDINHSIVAYGKELTISVRESDRYIGYLTAFMGLPYILGSSLLNDGAKSGSDTLIGADCSGFIVFGMRKLGHLFPYCNPVQLLPYLVEIEPIDCLIDGIAMNNSIPVSFKKDDLMQGLLLHFYSHIAVLYEDTPPYDILNDNDLVIHHLEGFPEITPLKEIKQAAHPFKLMKFK